MHAGSTKKTNNTMCKKNAFTILTRKKNQSQVIRQSIMFFFMLKILNIRYIQSRIHGNYVDLNISFSVIHVS